MQDVRFVSGVLLRLFVMLFPQNFVKKGKYIDYIQLLLTRDKLAHDICVMNYVMKDITMMVCLQIEQLESDLLSKGQLFLGNTIWII